MKHKKGKSSLYNVSILKLLKTKKKMMLFYRLQKKKDGVVLSVSGEDELDIVLVCKSISSCTHTRKHTHISVQSVQSVPGDESEGASEFYLFCGFRFPSTCLLLLLSDFLHFTE